MKVNKRVAFLRRGELSYEVKEYISGVPVTTNRMVNSAARKRMAELSQAGYTRTIDTKNLVAYEKQ